MPIIDNELVNDVPMESFESPEEGVGDYFLNKVKKNIAQFGDGQWLVSFSLIQINHYIFSILNMDVINKMTVEK